MEQQSIPITSNVAALVVAIPNLQPAVNDLSNVRNIANSTSAQKLVEYLGKNCPALMTDDTINNESFVVSMRPFLDKIRNFYAISSDYEKTKIRASKNKLKKNKRSDRALRKKMIKKWKKQVK